MKLTSLAATSTKKSVKSRVDKANKYKGSLEIEGKPPPPPETTIAGRFPCDMCGTVFSQPNIRTIHMNSHRR